MDTFDDRVRQHAYRLWVEEGCPEGRAEVHWDKARELVAREDKATGTKSVAVEPASRSTPAKAVESPSLDQSSKPAAPKRAAAARAATKVKTSGQPKAKETTTKKR
jgi:hypothetical protein